MPVVLIVDGPSLYSCSARTLHAIETLGQCDNAADDVVSRGSVRDLDPMKNAEVRSGLSLRAKLTQTQECSECPA